MSACKKKGHIVRVCRSKEGRRELIRKVLVKCRPNVANKLFITRVFNPVCPHTSAECSTQTIERSHMSKRG